MYAVRVKGRVPEDVEAELEARGIRYRPRDQSEHTQPSQLSMTYP